ncbi:MAG: hypothetical protein M1608_14485 [Candidatus Omnitrophica bacterium]|nr:hypothetical protein [Candidatus Omnitrophota bacterium]
MSGLAAQLYCEVGPDYFRVLAGPLARLYVDALEGEATRRDTGLGREEALALIEPVVEEHADSSYSNTFDSNTFEPLQIASTRLWMLLTAGQG